ncbi:hypothetical protein, partial [Acinetobacter pittii]|uniref:hypothetical protein n=1 Tax=Acinetobacter pittii TaxID=48296 RepID=UPI00355AFF8B
KKIKKTTNKQSITYEKTCSNHLKIILFRLLNFNAINADIPIMKGMTWIYLYSKIRLSALDISSNIKNNTAIRTKIRVNFILILKINSGLNLTKKNNLYK